MKFSFATSILAIASVATAATVPPSPPARQGQPASTDNTLDLSGTHTDSGNIASTANIVNQKTGATSDAPPNQPPNDTVVTAQDGQLTSAGSLRRRDVPVNFNKRDLSGQGNLAKRLPSGYTQVFSGTGTDPSDRDAAIEGTAYLTYSLVSNATYDVDDCLSFCDSTATCVFANLYYEFNNELLDFVFSEHSNLKCVLYADIHTAAEKTNFGGQQSEDPPAGLTYIQQSSGYAATELVEPDTPAGYEFVFGPTGGANNAPGYMGFAFLDKYDVQACADLCNSRDADSNGGACQYFNIWRALVDGLPTTYTCSMYFIPTDASTATNTGQGSLAVTYSRGYQRTSVLPDGGFEGFPCSSSFCFAPSYSNWVGTTPSGGDNDADIYYYVPYAHSGHGVGILGSGFGLDSLAGTLTPTSPLTTVAGQTYSIDFFHSSSFNSPSFEAAAFVQVLWNGDVIGEISGYSVWQYHSFTATGTGSDVLSFHGGAAPAYDFIDDIYVFLA
jgi:hypothetical protein